MARNHGKNTFGGGLGGRRSAIPMARRRAPGNTLSPSRLLASNRRSRGHRSPLTRDKSLPVEDALIRVLVDRTTLSPFFKMYGVAKGYVPGLISEAEVFRSLKKVNR